MSNIRRLAIKNIIFFKYFDMFFVEATNDLWKLFVPRRMFFRNCFILQRAVVGIFFSLTDNLSGIFYSSISLHLKKCLCVELDFLRQPVIFINEVCDKMSNRLNILDPNEDNQQLLARLWDATKQRGDGKMLLSVYSMQGI